MYDLYRKQFVHVLFIQTHGLDSEAFTVYRSSETDVVVYFLVFSLFSVPQEQVSNYANLRVPFFQSDFYLFIVGAAGYGCA